MPQDDHLVLLEQFPDPALLIDASRLEVSKANERAEALLGYEPGQLLGLKLKDLAGPEAEAALHGVLLGPAASSAAPSVLPLRRGDGQVIFLQLLCQKPEHSGRQLRVLLRSAQGEPAPDQEIHLQLQSNAIMAWEIGLYEHDHLTNQIYGCPRVRELYGLGPDQELTVEVFGSALYPADRDQALAAIAFAHTPESGGTFDEVHRINSLDGKTRWVYSRALTSFGEVNGVLRPLITSGSVQDITARKELEHNKEQLEEQFRQAQKMEAIGRLAGGIAHDFNNLLSVIMGFTSLASDKLEPAQGAQEDLREVLRASQRASALTDQLLAFSRKQILQPRVINVNEILDGIGPMIERLVTESIQLVVHPSPTTVNIKADPNQIDQMLLNLVVNARDAMPGGGRLTIEASLATFDVDQAAGHLELSAGHYVVISVSDSGHGMDAATQERIFEPFFTTKEPGRGTGLGLSTAFGIVRQSGGSIGVYSEIDKGTTFKLYFPCTDEPVSRAVAVPSVQRSSRGGVVLITEDDPQLRQMVITVLKQAGYTVLGAADPGEALELASKHRGDVDVLLTDVVMPGMSGKQLAEQLLVARPSTKVVYMSGYTENSIVHRGVLDEGINFLPKPVTPQALLAALDKVLQ